MRFKRRSRFLFGALSVFVGLFFLRCGPLGTYYSCPDGNLGLPWDLIGDEVDNDCNGIVDDTAPSLLDHRAHCGMPHEPCTLEPGSKDVRCIDGMCVQQEEGPEGVGNERGAECRDGIDNDGDGIKDNGPDCEVLIANAATPRGGPDGPELHAGLVSHGLQSKRGGELRKTGNHGADELRLSRRSA